jgi:hypothetical protein
VSNSEDKPVDTSIDPDLAPPAARSRRRGGDRHVVGQLVTTSDPEQVEDVKLDSTERLELSRLLTVGRRHKKITVGGHKVTIRTLDSGDEMRIGLFTKPYLDTQGFARAFQVGCCACGIVEIEGEELWDALEKRPLKEITDEDEIFAKNCEALMKLYPIVVAEIHTAIISLEREFAELYLKLGKSDG